MEDYSPKDYEDDYCYIVPEGDYCYVVPEDPQTLRSIDGTFHNIERMEVAPDSDPKVPNKVEPSYASLTPTPTPTLTIIDYSSEDYEDDYSYFDSEEPLTLRSIDGTPHSIKRMEVAPESDPQVTNAVEASMASLPPASALQVIESTAEATVPIHQRHEVIDYCSNPWCTYQEYRGVMLRNWIQRFLHDLARLRSRFYGTLCSVVCRSYACATRKYE